MLEEIAIIIGFVAAVSIIVVVVAHKDSITNLETWQCTKLATITDTLPQEFECIQYSKIRGKDG